MAMKNFISYFENAIHSRMSVLYYLWFEVQRLLAELLFENLADVIDTRKFSNKETLLHFSCHYGWLDVTKRLVEQYRCGPESEDRRGDTPLHVACHEGHVDTVRYLVSEGCSSYSMSE